MTVHWVKLELDIRTFDAARFNTYVERCRDTGIRLTTLAELGDTARHRRQLYDLNKECSADIPDRGEFYTFDEYLERRIAVPSYDPRGISFAMKTYGIGFAHLCGVDTIRTFHHLANVPAIAMNRRLGYVDAQWD
ncbi:GNAT family N-acetyltransferase [Streptomyces sp. NPDC050433]|uniref:GNAT family N-acetyltransferase n=1 Tax=unclassified Streptomyces TaxID=2593676 RepID=UPI003449F1DD